MLRRLSISETRSRVAGATQFAVCASVLLIVFTGCGSSGTPAAAGGADGAEDARSDARRFLSAAEGLNEHGGRSARIADRRVKIELQACPLAAKGHPPALQDRVDAVVGLVFFSLAQAQINARPFLDYASRLRAIPTTHNALQTVASSIASIAEETEKLVAAEIKYCEMLEEWKRSDWSRSYERTLQAWPYARLSLDEEKVRVARSNLFDTLPALRDLGLSFGEALAITSTALTGGW